MMEKRFYNRRAKLPQYDLSGFRISICLLDGFTEKPFFSSVIA